MFNRNIDLLSTNARCCFLWGPRQTGKSTLLRKQFADAAWYDLLKSDEYRRLLQRPSLFREECLALPRDKTVVVDEVQRVPDLLGEIHWLMENTAHRFILCGSSARKLKRGHAHLLGGRAMRKELFPLVSAEIPNFSLASALNHGLLPRHYASADARNLLEAYVGDYLREEIAAEALTRNVPAFSRFLEVAALSNGEMVEYSSIARECAVSGPTVRSYFDILQDTLLGRFVPAFRKRPKRRVVLAPKFYYFDVGVAGHLTRRGNVAPRSELFGRALEHLIFMEVTAHSSYSGLKYPVAYWRTASQIEVDFVLGDHEVALEVKGVEAAQEQHARGLRAFSEEYATKRRILVTCDTRSRRLEDGIDVLPWKEFLQQLWAGHIMS